jgi:hypothetical protein
MKQIVKNYTFNAPAKTVTLTDFTAVRQDRLQVITDVTTNQVIYNFADPTVSIASVASNVITLASLPSAAASTDHLMIIYDSGIGEPVYDVTALPGEAVGVTGSAVPGNSTQVAGSDASAVLHTLYADSAGRLATFEAGTVDSAPLSSSAAAVATTDTPLLVANLSRGEFEVCNFSQTDICIVCAGAVSWGVAGSIIVVPGGYYARSYTGAVHAIHNNTRGGVATGGNSGTTCLLTVNEWA